jgi:hypothetical protein
MKRRVAPVLAALVLLSGCRKKPLDQPLPSEFVVDIAPDAAARYLSMWRWTTGEDAKPVALTKFCDWIFERADGSIHHLSIQDASVERLSGSREQLADALATVAARDRYLSFTFVQRAEPRWETSRAG